MYVPATTVLGDAFVLPVARLLKHVKKTNSLTEDVCPQTHPSLCGRELLQEAHKVWGEELAFAEARGQPPSVGRAIWRSGRFRYGFWKSAVLLGYRGMSNALIMPLLLRALINAL